MRLSRCFQLLAVIVSLAGCGDTDSLGGATQGVSGAAGSSGSAGTSGGSGGSGGLPDEVTLEMDPFVVEGGTEAFMCQTFANPFGGNDVHLREFETHATPGSHHLVVNYARGELARDGAVTRCSGLEGPEGPFTTQRSDDLFSYQEGVAARLLGGEGLRLIAHYFNPGTTPATAQVRVTLRRARPETVRKLAWIQSLSYFQIDVPPHQSLTVQGKGSIGAGREWDLLWLLPHMHSRGVNFRVTAGPAGDVIYETDTWLAPAHKLDPPYRLNAGDVLNYSCTFFNHTDYPLTFGESAANNEMCLLVFHYTSSDNQP